MDTRATPDPKRPAEFNAYPGDRIAEISREAWRELGFWYTCDVPGRLWTFRADRRGLQAFATEIRKFLAQPEFEAKGEHAHLGPFSNLRLISGDRPRVDWRGIAGRREDFEGLALELESLAGTGRPGAFPLAAEFEGAGGFAVLVNLEEDGFDPASADVATDGPVGRPPV